MASRNIFDALLDDYKQNNQSWEVSQLRNFVIEFNKALSKELENTSDGSLKYVWKMILAFESKYGLDILSKTFVEETKAFCAKVRALYQGHLTLDCIDEALEKGWVERPKIFKKQVEWEKYFKEVV